MIYITGDIHGTISVNKRLNTRNFPQQKEMTKKDYVIIVGDFGLLWNGDKEEVLAEVVRQDETIYNTLY
ncbi:hypothetical protein [Paenibacillus polymyxa]|uniref:hypothetical protein n=1 Tax=Paenibacillus polymyxa TaxID=1406 RepID=UPI000AC87E8D|nr:hypothetical protein [Paenibacillus polymyxa]